MKLFYTVLLLLLVLSFMAFPQGTENNQLSSLMKVNDSLMKLGGILINMHARSLEFNARINQTEALIEVALCTAKGKLHENLLTTEVKPIELQTALLLLGFDPQYTIDGKAATRNDSFRIVLSWEKDNKVQKAYLEDLILDVRTKKSLHRVSWMFQGLSPDGKGGFYTRDDISEIVTFFDPAAILLLNDQAVGDDTLFYGFAGNRGLKHNDLVSLSIIPLTKPSKR